jgi:membrane-bound lytic murein transglycosylase B
MIACANSIAIEKHSAQSSVNNESQALEPSKSSLYKGWDLLAEKLISDGIPQSTVAEVFNSEKMPSISFIPFKLNPVESQQIYDRMTSSERLARAASFLQKYEKEFLAAENKFGVTKFIIAAIISVETNWGSFTGSEQVLNRLARIASAREPNNLILNFRKLSQENPSVSFEQVKTRSEYLFQVFYPHVLALFHSYAKDPLQILELKGSVAGAFGLPQFLPKSYEDHAVDGDKDGDINLFVPEDAIPSVASFLKFHGWRKLLSPQEKLEVLWHYNRSEAYGRAVIRVALSLQNLELNLN